MVLSSIISVVVYYSTSSYIASLITAIFIIFILIAYLTIQFRSSWMIITSRRVLKVIKSSLFIEHRRELKLEDIKATLVRKNITNALF
ncbi:hypothetical protein ACFLY2_00145 [Patescibacteria group bacterium]